MRIVLAGASGLIGTRVTELLRAADHAVEALRRSDQPEGPWEWDPETHHINDEAIEWADAVISLSGAPLDRLPWTPAFRRKIRSSRVNTTQTIADSIARSSSPPQVWVAGSAVGIYGDRPDEVLDEKSPAGQGFLASVVRDWEAATLAAQDSTRVVHARTGIVVAEGGAFSALMKLTRFGFGGKLGRGTQHWPWISLQDEAAALIHLATTSTLSGPINLTGPEPATVTEITREVARRLRRPWWAHVPAPVLKLALQDAAEDLLLSDQEVHPAALQRDGFAFTHPQVRDAIAELGSTH